MEWTPILRNPPINVVIVDYLPYFLWGGGAVAVLIILFVVISLSRKKKQNAKK